MTRLPLMKVASLALLASFGVATAQSTSPDATSPNATSPNPGSVAPLVAPPVLSTPAASGRSGGTGAVVSKPCPQPQPGKRRPAPTGCTTDAPPSPGATKVPPGAGVMTTSPTGMMTDPGHQAMPNAAATGKPKP